MKNELTSAVKGHNIISQCVVMLICGYNIFDFKIMFPDGLLYPGVDVGNIRLVRIPAENVVQILTFLFKFLRVFVAKPTIM